MVLCDRLKRFGFSFRQIENSNVTFEAIRLLIRVNRFKWKRALKKYLNDLENVTAVHEKISMDGCKLLEINSSHLYRSNIPN